ncbi:MAG: DUF3368 domain-containing protein [Cyclobacteriaceae bacterium]
MPLPSKVVIADTSCFILLDKIDEVSLLKQLFGEVVTTYEVVHEFGKQLPEWVKIESVKDGKYQSVLALEVDRGEASAIALSAEKEDALLILDDLRARKLAEKLGLSYTGTLGVIARSRKEGVITSVKPIIEKIRNTNFRFGEDVFSAILKAAGEE